MSIGRTASLMMSDFDSLPTYDLNECGQIAPDGIEGEIAARLKRLA
jgi:hypothetical protein